MFQTGDIILHKEYGWVGIVLDVWEVPWQNARVHWAKDRRDSICLLQNLIPYYPTP